jgi:hypothetical protein
MRRLPIIVVVLTIFVGAVACGGGTFFISSSDNGVSFVAISGTVDGTQVAIVDGNQITIVTLIDTGSSKTYNFCGNVTSQFPTDAFVRVRYRHNAGCDTVLQVSR